MNGTLEYIDNYFKGNITEQEKVEFERKIESDPVFAEEVAFYVASIGALKEEYASESKMEFRKLVHEMPEVKPARVLRLWPMLAAAAGIVAIVIGLFLFNRPTPERLASDYIKDQLKTMSVTMSAAEDSMGKGTRLYNEGKLLPALRQFESIIATDTGAVDAKKYAGIVSLKLGNYDKALSYFTEVERTPLYANPGKFYRAVTLMKRNKGNDTQEAKKLLEEVVQFNLEGIDVAKRWLKRF